MLKLSEKVYNQFEGKMEELAKISKIWYTKEELKELEEMFNQADYLKNRVIAIGGAEEQRLSSIIAISVKGTDMATEILKRRV